MKLITPCKNCEKNITIKPTKAGRLELEMKLGKRFDASCTFCGRETPVHVDEVEAVYSLTSFILPIIMVIGCIAMFLNIWNRGFIAFLPIFALGSVLIISYGQEARRINEFNLLRMGG